MLQLPSSSGEAAQGNMLVWPKSESIGVDPTSPRRDSDSVTLAASGARNRVVANAISRGVQGAGDQKSMYSAMKRAAKMGSTTPTSSLEISDLESKSLRVIDLNAKNGKASINDDDDDGDDFTRHTSSAIRAVVSFPSSDDNAKQTAIAVLDSDGCIRLFEANSVSLESSLHSWKSMLGVGVKGGKFAKESFSTRSEKDGNLLNTERDGEGTSDPRFGVDKPKHGKEDEKNEAHVGGNTWAGGSGGSDTAGLGGRGGPYRLDKGHKVHQVSEKDKQISAEAKARAAAMGKEAFEKRMKDIKMGKQEFENYEYIRNKVQQQANQLRQMLEELNVRSQERIWLKNQTHGELDDAKLVDGLTGDRMVFKRRGVPDDFQEDSGDGNGPIIKKRYVHLPYGFEGRISC